MSHQTEQATSGLAALFSYLKPHRLHFWYAVSASVANKILDLMPPLLVGWVIDSVRQQPPEWISNLTFLQTPFQMAAFLAIMGFLIFGFESLFQWMYQYGFMSLAQTVQHSLRMDGYSRLQSREMAYFENHRLGETMSVLNDDINQLERFLNTGLSEIIQLGVLFCFAGWVMASTSWQLASIGLIPIPVILLGSFYYQKKISPKYAKVRQRVGELNSRLENNISGIQVVKSFTAEDIEKQRVEQTSQAYRAANISAIRLNALYVPLIRTAVALGFSGVLLLGSYWVLSDTGVLTVGELVLFSMLIQRVLWPLTRIGVTLDELERSKASIRRIFNLVNTPSKVKNGRKLFPVSKGDLVGIALEHVSFHYDNNRPILNNISVDFSAGQTIGIAGTTGSGKSTLIKLLLRFYDPVSGSLSLYNKTQQTHVNLSELKLGELRSNIALVSQDVYLFHGTIKENIAYGSHKEADIDKVIHAAKIAELHDFVESLPNGYDSIVGERGIKLSGGQRQRLSIARAILKDAPIMIFDEATSSVDTETERDIQKNLLKITKGRTGIIIAHRLSTIRYADTIVVLKDGAVAESGPHDELIKSGGIYADLWDIQTGEAGAG